MNIVFLDRQGRVFSGKLSSVTRMGGSGYALYYLTRELAKLGHRVTVFKKTGNEEGVFDGVEYREYLSRDEFKKEFHDKKIDVLVALSDYAPLFLKVNALVKIIWMHTDFGYNKVYPDQKEYAKKAFWRVVLFLAGKLITLRIDAVFALSEWQKKGFMRFMGIPGKKIRLIRNGYNEELIASKGRVRRNRNRLIYASAPKRGLDILSQHILPALRKRFPDLEVHVFSYMKQDVYKGMDGIVTYEWLDAEAYTTEMAKGYLMVYPNHSAGSTYAENSCIAAIESQALGIPVVTSHRGALPETVQDGKTGFCIQGDPYSKVYQDEFIEKTLRLLTDNNLYRRMSSYAKERMFKEYRWSGIAREWIDNLTDLLRKKNSGALLAQGISRR
jgi:glycosyltransferase involved in cell wall biosynthesis